ncbi:Efflux pump membrane transporter BepG [Microbulbifer aggregans]|uniref:Efflux pump membrane transporter n=1 Tax=Microbulbifer aggregans TaxID=1769779 RepID=A0A1C9W8G1_9GAMM|nr:multidrug efflux RND transporter permease subunit [Microbulbifer aggregans]AOS97446.1 Efflux pump membrane transporter BepG [Microbulbifer aggregans]
MISAFCIRRPRFAFVISILITLAGLLSLPLLPVAQFPDIAPPTISVQTTYSGASADVMRDSVAVPIESAVNGVEGMKYMSSTSTNDGTYNLQVVFESGFDEDIAQVNVQNRVQEATPQLPTEVMRNGVIVRKKSTDILLIINLLADDDAMATMDGLFLANYGEIFIKDELARIDGVSEVNILGAQDYAMRIWLNPDRMASLDVTAGDVIAAIQMQNVQVAAGKIGAAPIREDQQFEYSLLVQGRLENVEEFENISIRARPDGGIVRMGDVARIELGSRLYSAFGLLDGKPSAVMAIYQLPDANAVEVAENIRIRVEELSERFPEGLKAEILYDTTDFVRASIAEVVETLLIAVALVVAVVFLFLQDWRASLIPAIAIPVSLIGTFALMLALGMTINTVTLFALILAIGIVVDDAVIVVENTQRLITEGLSTVDAALQSMREVTGPVIATTAVLLAVFVPVMLMPGLTGKMYQQFAITISIAVLISSINALTLSPALCSLLLRRAKDEDSGELKTGGIFGFFNRFLHVATSFYMSIVRFFVKVPLLGLATIVGIGLFCAWLFSTVPTGFVPDEDKGFFMMNIQLPEGASLERTTTVVETITSQVLEQDGVGHVMAVPGFNLLSNSIASNSALAIVILEPWDERTDPELFQMPVMARVQQLAGGIPEARIQAFPVPALPGLGAIGGFTFVVEDLQGGSVVQLADVTHNLIYEANQRPEIAAAFTTFQSSTPQLRMTMDKDRIHVMDLQLTDVYTTLQAFLGGIYVNDFNRYGKVFRVIVQADAQFRDSEEVLSGFFVRNSSGGLVPVSSVSRIEPVVAPLTIDRYNLYNSITINGNAAPGFSSGDAMNAMEEVGGRLPQGYGFEWTGSSLEEIEAGNMAPILFGLAVIFAYLFLVAQYESWAIPVAVLLAIPIALAGGLLATLIMGRDSNLYAQIGLVLLIAMAAKTAILMVEFAVLQRDQGKSIEEAALEATRLRFRAVVMTALSFVLGIFPLVIATGAGAVSRVSLGLMVFGGMLAATLFSTFLVPIFYSLIQRLREFVKGRKGNSSAAELS